MDNLPTDRVLTIAERWQYIQSGFIAGGHSTEFIEMLRRIYYSGASGFYVAMMEASDYVDTEDIVGGLIQEIEAYILGQAPHAAEMATVQ